VRIISDNVYRAMELKVFQRVGKLCVSIEMGYCEDSDM
jgi:hypothetical protein